MVEYFIAKRTGSQSRSSMERVSAIAVALSVAVMILTLAVIFGFKREIEQKLTTLTGDMLITSHYGASPSLVEPILRSDALQNLLFEVAEGDGIFPYRVAPYALRSATLRATNSVDGVVLKGVDSLYNLEPLRNAIVDGEMLDFSRSSRNALISQSMATQMELNVGSRLEILTMSNSGESGDKSSSVMRRDLYRVGGIFSAGLGQSERHVVITDIRNVQRLNGWRADQISGYETWLSYDKNGARSALQDAPYLSYRVNSALIYYDDSDNNNNNNSNAEFNNVAAFSIQSLYPSIFDWLIAHNVNAVVIITIMLIVAAFNIITALLIMVLERTQMIGVLKSLGMTNRSVRKIFLWRALGITLRGLIWGNGIGLSLCFLQRYFKVIKLDESGYMLDAVPIELSLGWLLLLNIGVVTTIIFMVTLPTRFATTIEPSKAIKYQ